MILAFDTYYTGTTARTVCLSFDTWTDGKAKDLTVDVFQGVSDYVPGEFYKRELPCIMQLLGKANYKDVEAVIVDGFVFLDDDKKPGLGAHLYTTLGSSVPVIGVAKTMFSLIDKEQRLVYRGESKKPLYVTSIGIDADLAKARIESMHGDFRIPTLLKALDRETRS